MVEEILSKEQFIKLCLPLSRFLRETAHNLVHQYPMYQVDNYRGVKFIYYKYRIEYGLRTYYEYFYGITDDKLHTSMCAQLIPCKYAFAFMVMFWDRRW